MTCCHKFIPTAKPAPPRTIGFSLCLTELGRCPATTILCASKKQRPEAAGNTRLIN
jgi:hypothetical protein